MSLTITSASNDGFYESKFGMMYKQKITLSDGTTGEVSAKSEGRWKVGDTVEIKDKQETQYGVRLKLKVPEHGGFSSGGSKSGSNAGYALSWAKKAVIANKVELKDIEEYARELIGHAKSVGDNGSFVVSYANDLFCDGFIERTQILDAAKKFDEITKRLEE